MQRCACIYFVNVSPWRFISDFAIHLPLSPISFLTFPSGCLFSALSVDARHTAVVQLSVVAVDNETRSSELHESRHCLVISDGADAFASFVCLWCQRAIAYSDIDPSRGMEGRRGVYLSYTGVLQLHHWVMANVCPLHLMFQDIEMLLFLVRWTLW